MKNSNAYSTAPAIFWIGNSYYISLTCFALHVVWRRYYWDRTSFIDIDMRFIILMLCVCIIIRVILEVRWWLWNWTIAILVVSKHFGIFVYKLELYLLETTVVFQIPLQCIQRYHILFHGLKALFGNETRFILKIKLITN